MEPSQTLALVWVDRVDEVHSTEDAFDENSKNSGLYN